MVREKPEATKVAFFYFCADYTTAFDACQSLSYANLIKLQRGLKNDRRTLKMDRRTLFLDKRKPRQVTAAAPKVVVV